MTNNEKIETWRQIIVSCQNSGMTTQQYCEDHNVNTHSYYYWMKRLRNIACSIPEKKLIVQGTPPQAIVPLTIRGEEMNYPTDVSSSTAVILHLNAITMEIRNGASESIIRSTIQALKSC